LPQLAFPANTAFAQPCESFLALSANVRGVLFMTVSMAGFTLNDTLVKVLSSELNMGQIMFVRGLFASAMISMLAWHRGALMRPAAALHPMVVLRTIGEVGATVAFLVGLSQIPLATASAILSVLPLAVTMRAALFLREPVGWRRWSAIAAGFAGVLIILRPGTEGFNGYALLICASVFFAALRDLATRRMPTHIPSLLLTCVTAITVTLTGALLVTQLGGWQPLSHQFVVKLCGAAFLILFGYQFIILAMRSGDISFVAPFRYTGLLWAIALGYLVFADMPDWAMISGSLIIVATGLYTLYRERIVAATKPSCASVDPSMAADGL
jgi:drug/metabolite transporter (DMT)-like permease